MITPGILKYAKKESEGVCVCSEPYRVLGIGEQREVLIHSQWAKQRDELEWEGPDILHEKLGCCLTSYPSSKEALRNTDISGSCEIWKLRSLINILLMKKHSNLHNVFVLGSSADHVSLCITSAVECAVMEYL